MLGAPRRSLLGPGWFRGRERAVRTGPGGSVAGAGQSPVRGPVFLGVSRADRRSGGRVPGCRVRGQRRRGSAGKPRVPYGFSSRDAPLSPRKVKQDEVRAQVVMTGRASCFLCVLQGTKSVHPFFFFAFKPCVFFLFFFLNWLITYYYPQGYRSVNPQSDTLHSTHHSTTPPQCPSPATLSLPKS